MSLVEEFKQDKIRITGFNEADYSLFKKLILELCPADEEWLKRRYNLDNYSGERFLYYCSGKIMFSGGSHGKPTHDFMEMYNEYFNAETTIEQELW